MVKAFITYDLVPGMIQEHYWEAWQKVNDIPEMKEAVDQFFQLAERNSIRVIYGTKIGL